MNIKLICNPEEYELLKEMLEKGGFTVTDDSDYVFYNQAAKTNYITGKSSHGYANIPVENIIYIESFAHDVIMHTKTEDYTVKEKIYQLEGMLEEQDFVRINISTIINIKQISHIKPSFNTKFSLLMSDGKKLDVTRSYYYKFKQIMNI